MCNLYSMLWGRAEMARLVAAMTGGSNQPPQPGVYPDYTAPVVIQDAEGQRVVRDMRWGMPSSKKALLDAATKRADKLRAKGTEFDFAELLKIEPDKGTTNVRNTASPHWRPWLGRANRCLVPFTSFSEPDQDHQRTGKPIWFALGDDQPCAFFAGVWTPHACVRKIKTGWEEVEAYGFLTTDSAEPVLTYHKKAMPVILTEPEEWDLWLSGETWDHVKALQRPLPEGRLKIVPAPAKPDAEPTLLL
jgi:putative SOS response-associated peptidase YedK